MKTVQFFRDTGDNLFRWEARTRDSEGHEVMGFGFTRRGALRDLRGALKRRESLIARQKGTRRPAETRKVDL